MGSSDAEGSETTQKSTLVAFETKWQPDQEVIVLLEKALAAARAGTLESMALVVVEKYGGSIRFNHTTTDRSRAALVLGLLCCQKKLVDGVEL